MHRNTALDLGHGAHREKAGGRRATGETLTQFRDTTTRQIRETTWTFVLVKRSSDMGVSPVGTACRSAKPKTRRESQDWKVSHASVTSSADSVLSVSNCVS